MATQLSRETLQMLGYPSTLDPEAIKTFLVHQVERNGEVVNVPNSSQIIHFRAAAFAFTQLRLGMHILEKIVSAASMPFLVLACPVDQNLMIMHPWLLYARLKLRAVNRSCLIMEDDLSVMQAAKFVATALEALVLEKKPLNLQKWHDATCFQIACELGMFMLVAADYELSFKYLSMAESVHSRLDNSFDADWIDYTLQSISRALKLAERVILNKTQKTSKKMTINSLIGNQRFSDPNVLALFVTDLIETKISLKVKKLIAFEAFSAGFVQVGLWITFCNIIQEIINHQPPNYNITSHYRECLAERLPLVTLDFWKQLQNLPFEIIKRMNLSQDKRILLEFQAFLYGLRCHLSAENVTSMDLSPYMEDFFTQWSLLRPERAVIGHWDILDRGANQLSQLNRVKLII